MDFVEKDFPIVCVGGSAGGLEAYIQLLQNLPADMGVAIVIVNHITRTPTMLHEVLPRFSSMPVDLITDELQIEPNRVFIIPENRDLHVKDGKFQLETISKPRGWPDVITVCLRSLTENWDGKLIAVIVSGYDGDGAAALCGIQQVGGIAVVRQVTVGNIPGPHKDRVVGCWHHRYSRKCPGRTEQNNGQTQCECCSHVNPVRSLHLCAPYTLENLTWTSQKRKLAQSRSERREKH